ncbi:MAG TPA: hypothetical protein PKL31_02265 [Fulvivirga sp.]|nr:hypothetical protein [Fulvivirga sp.]
MRYPILFFSFVLVIVVGFVLMFTNYSNPTERLNELMTDEPIDECYDNTMDAWFIEFNNTQEEGVTMEEADKRAAEKALTQFDECKGETK